MAREVGFPVMLKASWGGGGRGMRIVEQESELPEMVATARREAKAAFGNDEVYLEKLVRRARHIEVQLLGDSHGNLVHLFERDCTVQRRNQKVIERAPATFFTAEQRRDLCAEALKIGRAVNYLNAGTVEFLQDADTGKFYFIEVNPRVQVEHTVTEAVTGIDIVRAQIRIAEGAKIGDARQRRAQAGRHSSQRLRDAVSRHDRRSREQLHSRLRPHHGVSQPRRFRHSARRRHRLLAARSSRVRTIRCW